MSLETQTDLHQARDALLRWFLSQELSNGDALMVMTAAMMFLMETFSRKETEVYISRLINLIMK